MMTYPHPSCLAVPLLPPFFWGEGIFGGFSQVVSQWLTAIGLSAMKNITQKTLKSTKNTENIQSNEKYFYHFVFLSFHLFLFLLFVISPFSLFVFSFYCLFVFLSSCLSSPKLI